MAFTITELGWQFQTSGATNLSLATTAAAPAGSLIILILHCNQIPTSVTAGGVAMTLLTSVTAGSFRSYLYYQIRSTTLASGGAITVTLPSAAISFEATCVTGFDPANPIDIPTVATAFSTTATTTPSGVTLAAAPALPNSLIFGFIAPVGNILVTQDTADNFSSPPSNVTTNSYTLMGGKVVGSGVLTYNPTFNTAAAWNAITFAVRAAPALTAIGGTGSVAANATVPPKTLQTSALITNPVLNWIRNPRAEGAVAGTPGTMPTYWTKNTPTGISSTVVGSGYENGIPYVDIRFFGTQTQTGAAANNVIFESSTTLIPAQVGGKYVQSFYQKLIAGSIAGINNFYFVVYECAANGSVIATTNYYHPPAPPTTSLDLNRTSYVGTFTQSGAVYMIPIWYPETSLNAVIDITVRVGAPQIELDATLSSLALPWIGTPAMATASGTGIQATGSMTYSGSAVIAGKGGQTNVIRNPRLEGAVPGSPGTLPTFWEYSSSIPIQVIGTGIDVDGNTYIDIRWVGSTTTTTDSSWFAPDGGVWVVPQSRVSLGDVWTSSIYCSLVGGSLTNVAGTPALMAQMRDANRTYLNQSSWTGFVPTGTKTRFVSTGTVNVASAYYTSIIVQTNYSASIGLPVDFTLRISGVQLQIGSVATPLILPPAGSPAVSNYGVNATPNVITTYSAAALIAGQGGATNYVRNPRGEGAVVGTPGTLPTFWTEVIYGDASRQVVGTGIDAATGLSYVDIRYFGPGVANGEIDLWIEPDVLRTIAPGDAFGTTAWIGMPAGSRTNISSVYYALFFTNSTQQSSVSLFATAALAPIGSTKTAGVSDTTIRGPLVIIGVPGRGPFDITLRLAGFQLEYNTQTPPILPPVGAPAVTTRALLAMPGVAMPVLAKIATVTTVQAGAYAQFQAAAQFNGISGTTNYVRNPRAEGAVVGTPGTLPTFWTIVNLPLALTQQVVGSGVDAATGLPYVDIRIFGTAPTSTIIQFYVEPNSYLNVAIGDVTITTGWFALVGGSTTNMSLILFGTSSIPPSQLTATLQPFGPVNTASAAGPVAAVLFRVLGTSGPVDYTLRLAGFQLELNTGTPLILPPPGAPAITTRALLASSTFVAAATANIAGTGGITAASSTFVAAATANIAGTGGITASLSKSHSIYPLATPAFAPNYWGNTQWHVPPVSAASSYGWVPGTTPLTTPFYRGRLGATTTATDAPTASSYNAATSGPVEGTGSDGSTAGDSFIAGPFLGTFGNGSFQFITIMFATVTGCVGRPNVQLWRSVNADGTGAVLVKANTNGTIVSFATKTDQVVSITISLGGSLPLNNEYLFFQVEWEETTLGTQSGANVFFRTGGGNASVVTPAFGQPATQASVSIAGQGGTTNYIRNPRAEGAVVGTPGTLPTYWFTDVSAPLSSQVVAVGTDAATGLSYIDFRVSGTAVSTGTYYLYFEQLPIPNVRPLYNFASTAWLALTGGSFTNFNYAVVATTFVGAGYVSGTNLIGTLNSTLSPYTHSITVPGGATSISYCLSLLCGYTAGAIDVTIRVAGLQFEYGTVATPLILPPVGAPQVTTRGVLALASRQVSAQAQINGQGGQTNYVRNPRNEGAVVGTPGTLPTFWIESSVPVQLTRQVVAVGIDAATGLKYVDVRYFGTLSSLAVVYLTIEPNYWPATAGDTFTQTLWTAFIAGSVSALQFRTAFTPGGTTLNQILTGAVTATLAPYSVSGAAPAGTTGIGSMLFQIIAVTGPVDFTMRVAAAQLERSAVATPLMLPPVGAPQVTTRGVLALPFTQVSAQAQINGQGGQINWVHNPRGEGATPGVYAAAVNTKMPTWWDTDVNTGLQRQIIGNFVVDGINVLRMRAWGMPDPATDPNYAIINAVFEYTPEYTPGVGFLTGLPDGQVYTRSFYLRLVAGSWSNLQHITFWGIVIDKTGASSPVDPRTLIAPLPDATLTRYSDTVPLVGAVPPYQIIAFGLTLDRVDPPAYIDVTFDIGGGQVELGSILTPLILPPVGTPGASKRGVLALPFTQVSAQAQIDARGGQTNYVTNPRAEGAVLGSPGTLPTDWAIQKNTGLAIDVVDSGYEDDITPYVDLRFYGTTTADVNAAIDVLYPYGTPSSSTDTWAGSMYLRWIDGTTTNIQDFRVVLSAQLPDTPWQALAFYPTIIAPSEAPLIAQRTNSVATFTGTGQRLTASLSFSLRFPSSDGGLDIDITVRIGAPQLERNNVTSLILPPIGTPGAYARGIDAQAIVPGVTPGDAWMAGHATVTATPIWLLGAKAAIAGRATVTATASCLFGATATIASTSNITATATRLLDATATIAGNAKFDVITPHPIAGTSGLGAIGAPLTQVASMPSWAGLTAGQIGSVGVHSTELLMGVSGTTQPGSLIAGSIQVGTVVTRIPSIYATGYVATVSNPFNNIVIFSVSGIGKIGLGVDQVGAIPGQEAHIYDNFTTGEMPAGWTFSRPSTATDSTYRGGTAFTTYQANQPRLSSSGVLIEPASTNVFLNSETPVTQAIIVSGTYTTWMLGTGSITCDPGPGTSVSGGSAPVWDVHSKTFSDTVVSNGNRTVVRGIGSIYDNTPDNSVATSVSDTVTSGPLFNSFMTDASGVVNSISLLLDNQGVPNPNGVIGVALYQDSPKNSVSNPSAVGAVAGTPGTWPTNWQTPTRTAGLTSSIIGTGIEAGIPYIDIRFAGTSNDFVVDIIMSGNREILASNQQIWTQTVYLKIVGGSTSGIEDFCLNAQGFNSAGVYQYEVYQYIVPYPATTPLDQALCTTVTLLNSANSINTSYVRPVILFHFPGWTPNYQINPQQIDITLRIGWPTLRLTALPFTTPGTVASNLGTVNDSDLTATPKLVTFESLNFIGTLYTRYWIGLTDRTSGLNGYSSIRWARAVNTNGDGYVDREFNSDSTAVSSNNDNSPFQMLVSTINDADNGVEDGVKATVSRSTGKYYAEFTPNSNWYDSDGFGIATPNADYTDLVNDVFNGCLVFPFWGVWSHGGPVRGVSGSTILQGTWTTQTAAMAVDLDNHRIWFRMLPNGLWNGIAGADPTILLTGLDISALAVPLQLVVALGSSDGEGGTINVGYSGAFVGTIPTGFNAWPTISSITNGVPQTLTCSGGITNYIQNPRAEGAFLGPVVNPNQDALPTNWKAWGASTGFSIDVVGIGVEDGLSYVDVHVYGTTNNTLWGLNFTALKEITTSSGANWTQSLYFTLKSGNPTNIKWRLEQQYLDVNGQYVTATLPADNPVFPTGSLGASRTSFTATVLTNAAIVYNYPTFFLSWTIGQQVDLVLRFAGPQCEHGSIMNPLVLPPPGTLAATTIGTMVATVTGSVTRVQVEQSPNPTSYIPTAGVPATRADDHLYKLYPTGVLNVVESTYWVDWFAPDALQNIVLLTSGIGSYTSDANTDSITETVIHVGNQTLGIFYGTTQGFDDSRAVYTQDFAFYDVTTFSRCAFAVNATKLSIAVNNSMQINPGTPIDRPNSLTTITLGGGGSGDSGDALNGYIRGFRYWPNALPDNLLTTITDPAISDGAIVALTYTGTVAHALAIGQVGSVSTKVDDAQIALGVVAISYVGTTAPRIDQPVALIGNVTTSQVGSVAIISSSIIPLSGIAPNGQAGSAFAIVDDEGDIAGNLAVGDAGSLATTTSDSAEPDGNFVYGMIGTTRTVHVLTLPDVTATGRAGSVSIATALNDGSATTTTVHGVSAHGQVGSFAFTIDPANATLAGIAAHGITGLVTPPVGFPIVATVAIGYAGSITITNSDTATPVGVGAKGVANAISIPRTKLLVGIRANGSCGPQVVTVSPVLSGQVATGTAGTMNMHGAPITGRSGVGKAGNIARSFDTVLTGTVTRGDAGLVRTAAAVHKKVPVYVVVY